MEIHQCLREALSVCYTLCSLFKTDVLSASFWRFYKHLTLLQANKNVQHVCNRIQILQVKVTGCIFFWDKESLTSSGWTSLDLGTLNSQTLASFSLTSNGVKAIRSHSCFMPFWKLKFSSSAGPGFLSSVQRVFMGENLWTAEEKVQCKAVCLFFPPSCVLPNFPVTCALWFLLRIFRLDLNSTYRKLKNSSDYHG